ncbi:hypothetical protein GC174_03180 [bacterium]|nr:hypothetical protein [bacterium]
MRNLQLQRFLGLISGCVLAFAFLLACPVPGTIPGALAEAGDSPGDRLLDDYLDNGYSDQDSDRDSDDLLDDDDDRRDEKKRDDRKLTDKKDDDDDDNRDRLRCKWLEDFQDTDFRKKTFDDFLLRDPRRDSRADSREYDRDDDDGDDRDPVTKSDRDERIEREVRERRRELSDMRPDSSELTDQATLPGDDDDDVDDGRVTEQPDLGGDYEDDPAIKRDDERVFRDLTKPVPGMLQDWVPDRVNRLHNGAFEKEPDNGFPVPYRLNGHLDIERKRPWAEEAD